MGERDGDGGAKRLHVVQHGDPGAEGVPLVIAHGLFGSARNWTAIARRLAEDRPVLAVDMRNHGSSPWFDSHTYPDMAGDLEQVIAEAGGQADLLGHSMGGKAAMWLALTRPERVRRLIVADIAPVAYSHSQMPIVRALQAVDLSRVSRRRDADAQLSAQLPAPALRAFLLQSLDLSGPQPRWRLNLPVLARDMGAITGFPETQARFSHPALFLRGARSDYVRPEHRDTILRLFPQARLHTIADAGHWLHAEAPAAFVAAVRNFLDD